MWWWWCACQMAASVNRSCNRQCPWWDQSDWQQLGMEPDTGAVCIRVGVGVWLATSVLLQALLQNVFAGA